MKNKFKLPANASMMLLCLSIITSCSTNLEEVSQDIEPTDPEVYSTDFTITDKDGNFVVMRFSSVDSDLIAQENLSDYKLIVNSDFDNSTDEGEEDLVESSDFDNSTYESEEELIEEAVVTEEIIEEGLSADVKNYKVVYAPSSNPGGRAARWRRSWRHREFITTRDKAIIRRNTCVHACYITGVFVKSRSSSGWGESYRNNYKIRCNSSYSMTSCNSYQIKIQYKTKYTSTVSTGSGTCN